MHIIKVIMSSKFESHFDGPKNHLERSRILLVQISKADAARLPAGRVRRPLDLLHERLLPARHLRLPLPHAHHRRRQAEVLRVQGE